MSKRFVIGLAAALLGSAAFAKLPAPTEEQKAKAEEAKAKAAEAAKKDAELLGKAQDSVAARYIEQMKAKGVTVTTGAAGGVVSVTQVSLASDARALLAESTMPLPTAVRVMT